ncbi:VanZ family protein [Streptococcus sp. DD13]|uniref:VanZ family protein n=1 Tax=Streptococcus sp. DD13 TaxID=1777881 RepID=UPI000798F3E5|nr:VanZ family protein [Streptococcus sp. DD13]KXT78566.1 Protein vanZ [Streptococcus sp. DD13]
MKSKRVTYGLCGVYISYLIWIILFKMHPLETLLHASQTAYGSLNTTLFAGTAIIDGHLDYQELLLNILIFIPLGIYVKLLWERMNDFLAVGLVIGTSLLFEGIQYIFSIGVADITDVATNSLGGILGLILWYFLKAWWKKETLYRLNWIGTMGTVCFIAWIHTH